MRGLNLERPPRWGLLILVTLVLGNIALFSAMTLRPKPADDFSGQPASAAAETPLESPAPAASGTATPVPAAAGTGTPAPAGPPRLAVYGDGYAAGNDLGGLGAAGWPAMVAKQTGTELALHAVARAGYASVGVSGQDYTGLVQQGQEPDADITILFGSRNDANENPTAVAKGATAALAAVRAASPTTVLLVVGPVWPGTQVPAGVKAARDSVRDAAEAAGATFVDPLTEGWLTEPGLIASDGVSPNDAGHAALARLISPLVQQAMPAGATAGR